jgi:hypothetical protein
VPAARASIGTYREKPLHAALKRWYRRRGDRVEVPVDGYVIDLVRGPLLIEIQTRGFAMMKRKLATLLAAGHEVRIVHPVAVDRWLVKLDDAGRPMSRRRSPRHGQPADVFAELVSFPELLAEAGLEIELVLIAEEELRRYEPGRAWRRKGWMVVEHRLIEVLGTQRIRDGRDLAALLPAGLPPRFTTADLARLMQRPRRAAQQMAYCLRHTKVIVPTGKRGHFVEYRLA